MREKRGPLGRTVGAVAGSLANAARRGQAAATTRVVVYDADGHATMLQPGSPPGESVEYACPAGTSGCSKLPFTSKFGPADAGDPGSGSTYTCNIALDGDDRLRLRGYVGIPLLGRTTTWTRVGAEKQLCQGSR